MIAITYHEFRQLANYIKKRYGIHLKDEKISLVSGRLHQVLLQKNFANFSDYFDYLISDATGEAGRTLVDKITTNHTYFMREADHFDFFRDQVLPYLIKTAKTRDLRIWSAGCSSGEEPSTLAMIIDETLGSEKKLWDTKILATDISNKVLDVASKGIYLTESLANLPSAWKMKYFTKIDAEKSQLTTAIKNEIIYRKFNLMTETFPFKKRFQVIFCRNVMIYFDHQTKTQLVNKFYEWTEPGGYLFIGHAESLNRGETKYQYVLPAVYRKGR